MKLTKKTAKYYHLGFALEFLVIGIIVVTQFPASFTFSHFPAISLQQTNFHP